MVAVVLVLGPVIVALLSVHAVDGAHGSFSLSRSSIFWPVPPVAPALHLLRCLQQVVMVSGLNGSARSQHQVLGKRGVVCARALKPLSLRSIPLRDPYDLAEYPTATPRSGYPVGYDPICVDHKGNGIGAAVFEVLMIVACNDLSDACSPLNIYGNESIGDVISLQHSACIDLQQMSFLYSL